MKPIFANFRILRPLRLFKSSKFDIIFANWYSRKSTNRHKDDYTIIYFAKIIETFIKYFEKENIYIRNLQIICFKMINNLFTF